MLNGLTFPRIITKGKFIIFKVLFWNINNAIEAKDLKESPLEEIVPKQYYEFCYCLARFWQINSLHIK